MNIKQFWKAVLAQDEEEIRKYFHKDAYVNWHCTNEHFTVDEYIIANCEYPGEWDGIIERTEMVNELIITVTQISPHYDSRRRTNYAQKTSLTNSSSGLRNIFMLTSDFLRTAISSLEQSGYYSFLSAHGLQTGYLIQIHPYL